MSFVMRTRVFKMHQMTSVDEVISVDLFLGAICVIAVIGYIIISKRQR